MKRKCIPLMEELSEAVRELVHDIEMIDEEKVSAPRVITVKDEAGNIFDKYDIDRFIENIFHDPTNPTEGTNLNVEDIPIICNELNRHFEALGIAANRNKTLERMKERRIEELYTITKNHAKKAEKII